MRLVTFSSCVDGLSVVADCLAPEMLATESCRVDTDVGDPPLVVVTLQGPYRWLVPSPIDKDTISKEMAASCEQEVVDEAIYLGQDSLLALKQY